MNRPLMCFALVSALALTLTLSGCSSDETSASPTTDVSFDATTVADVTVSTDLGVAPEDTVDEPEEIFVPPPECTSSADCDDANPCTKDACGATGCTYTPDDQASCDDGDACTDGDACSQGACSGVARVCDDENACTIDWCVAGECKAAPDESAECAINILMELPQRASTLTGQGPFYVSGTVSSPASTPTLTINDKRIKFLKI